VKIKNSKTLAVGLFFSFFILSSCQKNPFWVGKSEFLTFQYSNTEKEGPNFADLQDNQSPFISHEFTKLEQLINDRVRLGVYGVSVRNLGSSFGIKSLRVYEKDSDNPDSTLLRIQESKVDRFAIGLKTKSLKRWEFKEIAPEDRTCFTVNDANGIDDYKEEIISKLTEKYKLFYEHSN